MLVKGFRATALSLSQQAFIHFFSATSHQNLLSHISALRDPITICSQISTLVPLSLFTALDELSSCTTASQTEIPIRKIAKCLCASWIVNISIAKNYHTLRLHTSALRQAIVYSKWKIAELRQVLASGRWKFAKMRDEISKWDSNNQIIIHEER